eukprot:6020248-Amphidinium_carterae.1
MTVVQCMHSSAESCKSSRQISSKPVSHKQHERTKGCIINTCSIAVGAKPLGKAGHSTQNLHQSSTPKKENVGMDTTS